MIPKGSEWYGEPSKFFEIIRLYLENKLISTWSFLAFVIDGFVLIRLETQERMPRKISSARARERDAERTRFLEEQERV